MHGDGSYAVLYDDGDDEPSVAERLIREPVLDEDLDDELRGLAVKALDAERVERSSLLRRVAKAVSKAASRASLPRLCSSTTDDVVSDSRCSGRGGGAMDAGGGAGAGGDARQRLMAATRTRFADRPGSTPEFDGVMSCSGCMDVATGRERTAG